MSSQKCISLISVAVLVGIVQLSCIEARTLYYTLEVYYTSGSPDGVHSDHILGFNGQSPGPMIEAEVGDSLEIAVVNRIQNGQNTTVHWHGINQKNGFLFEDGTSVITQCAIPSGRSQIYRFNLTQTGTFWYHSHVNSQYTEGMYGPMIIRGKPDPYRNDGEITLTLNDWCHRSAFANEEWHLSPPSRGVPPYPDSGMINEMGRYPCNIAEVQNRTCDAEKQFRPVIRIQREKTYRLRLINAAAVTMFNVSLDEHTMQAIEVDGIDVITPVPTKTLSIAAGQRYSLLVQCNNSSRTNQRYLLRANMRKESYMYIEDVNVNKYPEGSFNRTPFTPTDDKPLLMKVIDGEPLPPSTLPIEIEIGDVIQVVVNNPFFGPHPFHLHGHHFWVVGTGPWYDGDYDPSKHNLTTQGVKRDTFLVLEQSWAVIRFVADNPGVWIFHCHIDWHSLSGMAMVFVEGRDIIRETIKISDEALRVCQMHSETNNNSQSPALAHF